MQTILNKAISLFPEIKKDQVLKRIHIRKACQALRVSEDYSVFEHLTKVSHGNYAYDHKTFKCVEPDVKHERKPRSPKMKPTVVAEPKTEQLAVQNYSLPDFKQKVSQAKFGEVPARDTNYVAFGHYKDIENIVKSRKFFPVFITGMSGNGKSSMVMEACAKHNVPLIRVNITAQTTSEDLIGHKTLSDGAIVVVDGPVLIAMRNGIPLCLKSSETIRVGTLDNWTEMSLDSMDIGKDYPVVSYNQETSKFENDHGHIFAETADQELYEVTLENGSTVIVTSNHPFIVSDNKELSIDDGLTIGSEVVIM